MLACCPAPQDNSGVCKGDVASCNLLLAEQTQLVPSATSVLHWVSQCYSIIAFLWGGRGKGLNLVIFFLQQNFFLLMLTLIPRKVKRLRFFNFMVILIR